MSPDIKPGRVMQVDAEFSQINREHVEATINQVKAMAAGDFGEGELRNQVIERLAYSMGLPIIDIEGFKVPDFNDPKVQQLSTKIDQFNELF